MRIDTSQYVATHGKNPRGFGQWAFATTPNPAPENIYWFTGNYATARKSAADFFRGKQPPIFVLP